MCSATIFCHASLRSFVVSSNKKDKVSILRAEIEELKASKALLENQIGEFVESSQEQLLQISNFEKKMSSMQENDVTTRRLMSRVLFLILFPFAFSNICILYSNKDKKS